jgi:hypothetical protein
METRRFNGKLYRKLSPDEKHEAGDKVGYLPNGRGTLRSIGPGHIGEKVEDNHCWRLVKEPETIEHKGKVYRPDPDPDREPVYYTSKGRLIVQRHYIEAPPAPPPPGFIRNLEINTNTIDGYSFQDLARYLEHVKEKP